MFALASVFRNYRTEREVEDNETRYNPEEHPTEEAQYSSLSNFDKIYELNEFRTFIMTMIIE